MKESLDQRRAGFAWERVKGQSGDYVNLAKGVPALIMQSGLMPVLAFLQEKSLKEKNEKDQKQKHHTNLRDHLCEWLQSQFPHIKSRNFPEVMSALIGNQQNDAAAHAQFYRMATEETLAILRWIRQFAAAVAKKD